MALRTNYNTIAYEADTAAEIADKVFEKNSLITALDSGETKKGDGATKFSSLPVFSGSGGNTTYTEMTAEDAETGTSTLAQLVSAKVLNEEVARQIAAIVPAG